MAETQKLSVGEIKFRSMVNDLMVMDKPFMNIECPNASKARSLRRCFYLWRETLAEMEKNFMAKLEFKVQGRNITVLPKHDWTPKEVSNATSN